MSRMIEVWDWGTVKEINTEAVEHLGSGTTTLCREEKWSA